MHPHEKQCIWGKHGFGDSGCFVVKKNENKNENKNQSNEKKNVDLFAYFQWKKLYNAYPAKKTLSNLVKGISLVILSVTFSELFCKKNFFNISLVDSVYMNTTTLGQMSTVE